MTPRAGSQHGAVAVEAALIAPGLLVLMLLVVYAGRAAQADTDVHTAAARAARAASMTGDTAAAVEAASTVAAANLATAGITCHTLETDADTRLLHAGWSVTVSVACRISNTDLALLAVPGSRWSVATATHVIDVHRGGG